jgi:hypothetical protein
MKRSTCSSWISLVLFLFMGLTGLTATAQTDVTFVELDVQSNPNGDSLRIYVRTTSPTDFDELVSELKYTLRWPASSTATIGNRTQFCAGGYNMAYYQNLTQVPTSGPGLGWKYATMVGFGGAFISDACPGQEWPAGQWKLIQRVFVQNITGCTPFNIVNDGYTAITGRETYVELMGQEIPHSIDATPAYIGLGAACAQDCLGVPGGTATVGTPCNDGNPNTGNDTYNANCECVGLLIDCANVPGGTASVDLCGVCSGGTTGITPNACLDCAGVPNGTASVDLCGVCSGGNTGITPNACVDCAGVVNGTASIDLWEFAPVATRATPPTPAWTAPVW